MNQTLLQLVIEQLIEALTILEDIDEAAEVRGMLKASGKILEKLRAAL